MTKHSIHAETDGGNATQAELLDAILRKHFYLFFQAAFAIVSPGATFIPNWHLEVIANALMELATGKTQRLIINVPPRSGKSIMASVALPAFILGQNPKASIVCASYSQDLAAKLARDTRQLIESATYRRLFPNTILDKRRTAESDFMTTARGGRLATSIGGTLTGRGGEFVIIDDPIKPNEAHSQRALETVIEWATSTLASRLNDKKSGGICLVMQRVHVDDLAGFFLQQGGWKLVSLPAIATKDEVFTLDKYRWHVRHKGSLLHPEREPLEVIQRMQIELGSANFAAQYQQDPAPPGGIIINPTWFRQYEPAKLGRRNGDLIIQSWDTANTPDQLSDYSVCTTWLVRDENHFLLSVYRAQLDFPTLRRAVIDQAHAYPGARVVIEDKASGTSLIQDLQNGSGVNAIAFKPEGDKVMRAWACTAQIEAGRVLIPISAPWLDEFLLEVRQFPRGRKDDQVDSMTQFLGYMEERRRNGVIYVGPIPWA